MFYKELEQVLDHFPKYYMKILVGDFNVKEGRKIILKTQLGMRVCIRVKDNGIRTLNLPHQKKSIC
jgi:chemotaxis receptor (MCP) glutamine deamidase CheD